MPTHKAVNNEEPRAPLPAWIISVVMHAVVLGVALLVVQRAPRGAMEQPGRDVGIVLKRSTSEGDFYEEEILESKPIETDASESSPEASLTEAPSAEFLNSLPSADASASLEAYLPQPGIGPATATSSASRLAEGTTEGAGAGRRALTGGQARVSVFGVEGVGSKFVYAFDRSVSMNGAPLAAAKRQLLQSLESLERTHQFQILFFNHNLSAFDLSGGQNRIAFANEQTLEMANRFVGGITADGGTDRYAALRQSLRMEPDVIFFLTDADDAMSTVEMQQLAALNRRVGATICTIEFGRGPQHGQRNFLVQLAEATGGQYGYVDTTRLAR